MLQRTIWFGVVMDKIRQASSFNSSEDALVLATAGRVELVRLVGSTIVSCYRRLVRHVGPMRGSVTAPRSGAF